MTYSLKTRLSIGLLLSLFVAFFLLWFVVSSAIRSVTEDYITTRLVHDSETLLAALNVDENSRFTLSRQHIDTVFQRPFSGHYYQITIGEQVLHSRSLWDQQFESIPISTGDTRRLHLTGPQQQPLLALVSGYRKQGHTITLIIAEDMSQIESDIASFQRRFTVLASVLLLLLLVVQIFMIRSGLRPLQHVRNELNSLQHGELHQLNSVVPAEISPLVIEINRLLQILNARLQRSRHALGDLAHALKKPLTVLRQLEQRDSVLEQAETRQLLANQTHTMQHIVERQLKRARLAGEGPVGTFLDIAHDVPALVDALQSIYRDKNLRIETRLPSQASTRFDREDLLELLGNLLDNACKWAQQHIYLSIEVNHGISILIEDDGPGVSDAALSQLSQRGNRLDESVEGHGLGLAIVRDIVADYDGTLEFKRAKSLGGFAVYVTLPQRGELHKF